MHFKLSEVSYMVGKKSIIIIGAGASGLAAAINSARILKESGGDFCITVVEQLQRVGKKILATGNGRCNLSNVNISKSNYHGDVDFAFCALDEFGANQTIDFFKSIGVLTTQEDGRIYPMNLSANSVLDCLRLEANRLGIEFICSSPVLKIKKVQDIFLINDEIKADCVIIATGGKSSSVHGSNGSGYKLLSQLGHSISSTSPALVQLVSNCDFCKHLKGIRVNGKITLKINNKNVKTEYGEILFTDYGLSGIATMQVARYVSVEKSKNPSAKITANIDMACNLSYNDICDYIIERKKMNKQLSCENLLIGILQKRVAQVVLKKCNISPQSREIQTLTKGEIQSIASCIKNFEMHITETKGFDSSQVTAGGAMTCEFEPISFKSKKVKNLYACGEVLNVDGDCGGYNLQWAWCSGYLAGKSCAEEILNVKNK